ncbi:hemoglobin subunit alpha-D-like [Sceloporus undulatus]|uniref:hemoglobin subunit alpha-D-like n=1 Tax=Sceloporus undulatus TaxID=8520 RepID=UPI001C4C473E|nr:hemoglobin subunit alpha-D-like [Sceloporus undulatus]XP_042294444.1 hemoglobin subunit alpha-D-like [Sceloporus undulatus]
MVLTADERKVLTSTWAKVSGHLDEMGGDALCRMLTTFPQTKTYFPHYDMSPGSKDLQHHGQKVAKALDNALHHLDNVRGTMSDLADLHAYNLRVDPVNFKLLAKCFHVVLATYLRADYTCYVYLCLDKFFYLLAEVLTEKYR